MTNRIDYLNKIKTNTHNNLADSTTLIKTFDDMDNGFVNNILVNGSTILFRNTSEMIKNNKKNIPMDNMAHQQQMIYVLLLACWKDPIKQW
ncbi:hypothetical protein [Candidatus Hodgkinia cicadicola]|uniref:hypothetical protein n=1 Tax=Candidatus Hodgkinia cicadicola TaxID=573658 RepID=UPI002415353B